MQIGYYYLIKLKNIYYKRMTKLALILTMALGFGNTPYENKLTLWPELELKHNFNKIWFTKLGVSARTNPTRLNRMNPKTALWDLKFGYETSKWTFVIGHVSEHGIDIIQMPTESYDYISVRYNLL